MRNVGEDGRHGDDLELVVDALALKDVRRTGWELRGVRDPESVAAHAWGTAYLCLVFGDRAGVDVGRAVELAIVHDLAEAETGDVPTRADPAHRSIDRATKHELEARAIQSLTGSLDQVVTDRWEEYEARETPEARFVKDMDLLDTCLQALVYERDGRYPKGENRHFDAYDDLDEFFATAEPRLSTSLGRQLYADVWERYERARDRRENVR